MASARFDSSSSGFTLIETLVATGIMAVVALGVAQLFVIATDANRAAKQQTSATTLAQQKIEQLRGLTWGFDTTGLGLPVSDTSTNLSVDPADNSGSGLNPSPPGTLDENTPGYVDFLDRNGRYLGNGSVVPRDTLYIRRWSIEPLPTNPNNTLVLQVLVTTPVRESLRNHAVSKRKAPGDAWLVSMKTRKAVCANGATSC
jgi:prepilin-type N-terminal cleavage/methylation domain-containing protein